MNKLTQEIFEYIKKTYNASPEYLWKKFPNHCVFRNSKSKKWFVLFGEVKNKSLGINSDGNSFLLDIKLDKFEVEMLKNQQGFLPAYHMNKQSWITILLNGEVPLGIIEELIDKSFSLSKKNKKKQKPLLLFLARPEGLEPSIIVPKTIVISTSLWAHIFS